MVTDGVVGAGGADGWHAQKCEMKTHGAWQQSNMHAEKNEWDGANLRFIGIEDKVEVERLRDGWLCVAIISLRVLGFEKVTCFGFSGVLMFTD